MGIGGLLGDYDSDEEKPAPDAAQKAASNGVGRSTPGSNEQEPDDARDYAYHGRLCGCDDCVVLLQRFAAKNLQTKGIRFKCKLCGEMAGTKTGANEHFQRAHAVDLQAFKKLKEPRLFQAQPEGSSASSRKISFARDDVLKKRPLDDVASFGGFAKKEKPAPPPCMTEEYQQQMQEPVFTAPPWANKSSRPSDDDATEMDKEVDRRVQESQQKRFSKRNILEVNATTVRCKLCYKTLGSVVEADRHIGECHKEDFLKEMQIWERFLHTMCRRQPPFGWVCKVCSIFFPTDGSVWRHLGKEVFIRLEERHLDAWHQKEDRWGHEEDEECCGDGMNANGLSYESVQRIQEEARRLMEEQEAKEMGRGKPEAEDDDSDGEEEDGEGAPEPAEGNVKFINEF